MQVNKAADDTHDRTRDDKCCFGNVILLKKGVCRMIFR
jgi:hypothetical protein